MNIHTLPTFVLSVTLVSCAGGPIDRRQTSPHFKGGTFLNTQAPEKKKSWFSFLRMRITTDYADWPEKLESTYGPKPAERVPGSEVVITPINHSTLLIQTAGVNILTDPIYSERCSPFSWIGPKRVVHPGIRFEDLPKIDVILISHDHYDHLDLATIEKLKQRDQPKVYLGLGVAKHLKDISPSQEMDWWESAEPLPGLKLHFVPVQHFSGRGLFDRNSTLWGGYVVEVGSRKIYFGGDTGYASHFKETAERLGPIEIALLPIGAYEPTWFMAYAHVNPAEAVQAHIDLKAKVSIGIHYGTFQLTAEQIEAPIVELESALKLKNIERTSFLTPKFGTAVSL